MVCVVQKRQSNANGSQKRSLLKEGKKRNFQQKSIFQINDTATIDLLIHSNLQAILGLIHIMEFINYHNL